jgi:hypothetical protein
VISNAAGTVALKGNEDGLPAFDGDRNPANDKATLVLNPTSGGGQGVGLPVTGPQSAALATGGVLLLATGAIGITVTRRRRTRFEA